MVVAGLAINLLASYLKPNLDRHLSRVSSRWGERSEARKRSEKAFVERLRGDMHKQMLILFSEERKRSIGLTAYSIGILIMIFFTISLAIELPKGFIALILALAALAVFGGVLVNLEAIKLRNLLLKATDEDEVDPTQPEKKASTQK